MVEKWKNGGKTVEKWKNGRKMVEKWWYNGMWMEYQWNIECWWNMHGIWMLNIHGRLVNKPMFSGGTTWIQMWPVHLWFCGKSFSFLFGENLVMWIHHNIISNIFWGVLWTFPSSKFNRFTSGSWNPEPTSTSTRFFFWGGNLAVLESSFQAKRPESGRIWIINGHSCKQCRSLPSRFGVLLPQPWSAKKF